LEEAVEEEEVEEVVVEEVWMIRNT